MANIIEYMVNGGCVYFDPDERAIIECDKDVTEAYIPDIINNYAVEGINSYAFCGCKKLKKLNIPKNIKYIGEKAFYFCNSLTELDFDAENPVYSYENGIIYNKDITKIICCIGGIKDLAIPSTITTVDD